MPGIHFYSWVLMVSFIYRSNVFIFHDLKRRGQSQVFFRVFQKVFISTIKNDYFAHVILEWDIYIWNQPINKNYFWNLVSKTSTWNFMKAFTAFIRLFKGINMLTKRSTLVEQTSKSESIHSQLSIAIFIAPRNLLGARKSHKK